MANRLATPLLRRCLLAEPPLSTLRQSPLPTRSPFLISVRQASVNSPTAAEELQKSISSSASAAEARGSSSAPDGSSTSTTSSQVTSRTATTPAQRAINANRNPNEHRAFIELKKERKLKEYERAITAKALSEGITVDELKARVAERAKAKASSDAAAAAQAQAENQRKMSEVEQRDARVAAEIRERAEKEARRKLESGELGSGPGSGKGPKPLSSILDVDKLSCESVETITKLWTGYHSLKNKLSSVVPLPLYNAMVARARRYPQFVLPLPRTVTVGAEESEERQGEATAKEKQQGYEMYYLEWGFLPPPPSLSKDAKPAASPCTVLFTPLAEYKLRQEFAQPTLVLTFYVDLSASHDVVLMRGDITGADEAAAAPTGLAAAMSAASKGASQEEVERLKAPLQSQGKVSQQDAQLLVVALQRFFMPPVLKKPSSDGCDETKASLTAPSSHSSVEAATAAAVSASWLRPTPDAELDDEARERLELLRSFHEEQEAFDLARLCKVAFLLG